VIRPFKPLKKELTKVARLLPDFSRLGPVYLVGGSLRDRILKRPSSDYDFVVESNARAFAGKVAARLRARVIEMGKGERVVYRIVSGGKVLDFSPLHGKTINDDLRNRDFTINGLGFDLGSESLIDPVGGLDDIQSGIIRLISNEAITNDPLRMLRAFRLAAILDFDIEAQTLSAIAEQAPLVTSSAGERIRSELWGLMEAERSFPYLKQMSQVGLLMKIVPELEPCCGCPDNHGDSIFEHVMRTYEEMEVVLTEYPYSWPEYAEPIRCYLQQNNRKVLLRWAALLHDLGKPSTYSMDHTGRLRYLTHEEEGASIARGICTRLRMSGQQRSYVEFIIRNHLHPLHLFDARRRGVLTTRGLVRFVRKYEDHIIGLLLHSLADQRAKTTYSEEFAGTFVAFLKEIFHRYFDDFKPTIAAPRLVSGKDIMEHFGLAPSKLLGRLLRKVEEARLNREIHTKEQAFDLVARLLQLEGDAGIEPATPSSGGLCSIR
jgi:poly(A) polymerase